MSFGYYVTRQAYFYSGCDAVEIADGETVDVVGTNCLFPRFLKLGEGKKFDNPRDALKAAIRIARAWDRPIAINSWRGYGGEGEVVERPFQLLDWLHMEERRKIPCERCGKKIHLFDAVSGHRQYEDLKFCSEHCAAYYSDDWLYEYDYDDPAYWDDMEDDDLDDDDSLTYEGEIPF